VMLSQVNLQCDVLRYANRWLYHNLRREGYEVLTASDVEEALVVARVKGPALMLSDIILPILDRIEA